MKKQLGLIIGMLVVGILLVMPIAAQDAPIEITFVHIFGEVDNVEDIVDVRIAVIQSIINDFMAENPNVVVRSRSTSTDYVEVFNNALAAAEQGTAPHVIQVEEGLTQIAADTQMFVPISDLATPEQLATLDDFLPQVREYYNVGDDIWGIPWNSSNPVLYYNRGMFEEAGLDPDSPPRTFAEVLEACEAITAALPNLQSCTNWPMVAWFPEQWVAMQNVLIADNDNGRSARASEVFYDSDAMLFVAEWWQEMADRGFYSYTGSASNYTGEAGLFITRRTAMTINSTAGLTNFISLSDRFGIDLGVGRLFIPHEDATAGVTVGGASVWISAGHSDAELEAARDFVFFLTNTENNIRWHQGSGYFPNRTSALEQLEADGWFEENPFFAVAIDQLRESEVNVATAGAILGPSAQVRGFLIEAFQSIIDGGQDPLEALQIASQRGTAELQAYNSLFD